MHLERQGLFRTGSPGFVYYSDVSKDNSLNDLWKLTIRTIQELLHNYNDIFEEDLDSIVLEFYSINVHNKYYLTEDSKGVLSKSESYSMLKSISG